MAGMASVVAAVSACGSGPGAIAVEDPSKAFAPVVLLDPDERWRPMGADWFLDRAALWFAEDHACEDRKVAVGRQLKAQRNPVVDWLFVDGLGGKPYPYDRYPLDEKCDFDLGRRFYANELTRPGDPGPRVDGIAAGEGFYLDLMDWAREGPRSVEDVPAYVEHRPFERDGTDGLRITYWLLFGMNEPLDRQGDPVADETHEGDWERIDVLVEARDGGEYLPVGVQTFDSGRPVETSWEDLQRVDGPDAAGETHPVLAARRGSHELSPLSSSRSCSGCPRWTTWRGLQHARKQLWYGFGGAWGELGVGAAPSGPLGPHGQWPKPAGE